MCIRDRLQTLFYFLFNRFLQRLNHKRIISIKSNLNSFGFNRVHQLDQLQYIHSIISINIVPLFFVQRGFIIILTWKVKRKDWWVFDEMLEKLFIGLRVLVVVLVYYPENCFFVVSIRICFGNNDDDLSNFFAKIIFYSHQILLQLLPSITEQSLIL